MNKAVDTRPPHAHAGGWVPRDQAHVARAVFLAVAGRAFDLDHLRAHLGQVLRRQRAGQQLRQVENADAGKQSGIACVFGAQRNTPSRSHLVATHFSPATTGAPPCSVLLLGCARS